MFCLGIASYLELVFVVEGIPRQDHVNQYIRVSGSCWISATSATAGIERMQSN